MFKVMSLMFVGLLSLSVKAEVYTCYFTEPFITATVDTETKVATWEVLGESYDPKEVVLVDLNACTDKLEAKLQIRGAEYNLHMDFTKKGSDGMSDLVYPYTVS